MIWVVDTSPLLRIVSLHKIDRKVRSVKLVEQIGEWMSQYFFILGVVFRVAVMLLFAKCAFADLLRLFCSK